MIVLTLPCKPSTNRINDRGYPIVWRDGKPRREHRVVFARTHGVALASLDGKVIRHRCDNPACIEPTHLEEGTQADNMRDMSERGRCGTQRGSLHKCSKLVEADIPRIRSLLASGQTQRQVARQFAVDQALIGRIARRVSWSHVE
jgi:hypothetical protein